VPAGRWPSSRDVVGSCPPSCRPILCGRAVITGEHGLDPVFAGAADYDLELLETRTLDGRTQELVYRPTLH